MWADVAEALSGSNLDIPNFRRHLYTEDGKLVNVYLNDEDVRYLQKEATAVKDGDDISISYRAVDNRRIALSR